MRANRWLLGVLVLAIGVAGCSTSVPGAPTPGSAPITVPATTKAPVTTPARPSTQPAATGVPAAFVGDWQRHVTSFVIKADGTGRVSQRTYTPCGTAQDCAFTADLKIVPGTQAGTVLITYAKVSYLDENGAVMKLSAADHVQLDPTEPLAGEQASAVVDAGGRLVLSPIGRQARPGGQPQDGDIFCGAATKPDQQQECGA